MGRQERRTAQTSDSDTSVRAKKNLATLLWDTNRVRFHSYEESSNRKKIKSYPEAQKEVTKFSATTRAHKI